MKIREAVILVLIIAAVLFFLAGCASPLVVVEVPAEALMMLVP